jgi:hypothetical protein
MSIDRAEKENWTYRDFLALLLAEEVAHRKQTRLQRCTRSAHFPLCKTIDEFDFSLQTTLRQSLLGSCLGPDFVTEGRSLILYARRAEGKRTWQSPSGIAPSRMASRLSAPRRRAHRGSFQGQPERTVARSVVNLYPPSRFGDR